MLSVNLNFVVEAVKNRQIQTTFFVDFVHLLFEGMAVSALVMA